MVLYQPPKDLVEMLQGRLLDLVEAHLTQVIMSVSTADLLSKTAFSRDSNHHEFNLTIANPLNPEAPIRYRIKIENDWPSASKVTQFKKRKDS